MSITVANITGANIKRLTIEQFGSNLSHAVLQNDLLSDASKYDVTIEEFFVSADIPILYENTHIFSVYKTNIAVPGDDLEDDDADEVPCYIGPCYNWLDFTYQIQDFLDREINLGGVEVYIQGSLIPQKNLSFNGNAAFWEEHIIHFTTAYATIFEFQTLFARTDANGDLVSTNTKDADGNYYKMLEQHIVLEYTNLVSLDFVGEPTAIMSKGRLDLFENRHRIRIDSVLSLPHELYAVGKKNQSAEVSNRHVFMEFDFPKETLWNKFAIENGTISDNQQLSQILHTGVFRLIKPNLHSGLKKMMPGQSQTHRYELFLIRKRIQYDGTIKLIEEPLVMSGGDFFRLVLLFTKEV